MARSRIIPLIGLILSCGVLINGCLNHTRLPSEGEERLIQQHSGVIVLLRLRTVVEGKPWEDIKQRETNENAGCPPSFPWDMKQAPPPGRPGNTSQKREHTWYE